MKGGVNLTYSKVKERNQNCSILRTKIYGKNYETLYMEEGILNMVIIFVIVRLHPQ